MVVVIDHHAAHIYHDLGGSRPEDEAPVKPYDPFGFQYHLIHRKKAHYHGDHVPEEEAGTPAWEQSLTCQMRGRPETTTRQAPAKPIPP